MRPIVLLCSVIHLRHGVCACIAAMCVHGFLPAFTRTVFCEAHVHIVLLPMLFYPLYLLGEKKDKKKSLG